MGPRKLLTAYYLWWFQSVSEISLNIQWSRKLFLACRTKCPAGLQCSAGHFQLTGKYQWSFLFPLSHILSPLNTAGQNVQQGLSSLPDFSRSLPDMSGMSGIFRDHWFPVFSRLGTPKKDIPSSHARTNLAPSFPWSVRRHISKVGRDRQIWTIWKLHVIPIWKN